MVTHLYPGLKYPYHSYDEMRAAGYDVVTGTAPDNPRRAARVIRKAQAAKPRALVSTRSVTPRAVAAPKAAPKKVVRKAPVASGKPRYIQIGAFSVPSNAEKAAAQARARGLPVRLGTLKRGGKSYRVVLAGPYAADQAGSALQMVKRAGYRDAILR